VVVAPYRDLDEGHRTGLQDDDVMSHARGVFGQGLQLEAILLAHEYLEQRLNALYRQQNTTPPHDTIHRRYKQLIDAFRSTGLLSDEDYQTLNANQILNQSLTLRGAKKGDMEKAMNLAQECDSIISRTLARLPLQRRKKNKGGKNKPPGTATSG
jgi:hypothetical protein